MSKPTALLDNSYLWLVTFSLFHTLVSGFLFSYLLKKKRLYRITTALKVKKEVPEM